MSTHMPGLQLFFRFFASLCIGQISHQQYKGFDVPVVVFQFFKSPMESLLAVKLH